MNVLQFWLIDSIVKGSNNYSPLSLVSDTPRGSMDPDTEPLFRASEDDDDDDGLARRHDIENPAPRRRSVSRSHSRSAERPTSIGEPKSLSSGSATAIPSGQTTPVTKPINTNVSAHAYPPSIIAGSPSSASSSSSTSSLSKSRRRTPPPPLTLKAQKSSYPDIEISRSAPPNEEALPHDDDEKWAAWGDEDDWAERVGEEDWTGRRLEARKDAVDDAWRDSSSPHPHSIPVS